MSLFTATAEAKFIQALVQNITHSANTQGVHVLQFAGSDVSNSAERRHPTRRQSEPAVPLIVIPELIPE